MRSAPDIAYEATGYCPICASPVTFTAAHEWFRESLTCSGCGSVPRERALALVLSRSFPTWRQAQIHESSPADRGISPKLGRECPGYLPTQFFPGKALGSTVRGVRNEDLEQQTFTDNAFDLVISLDVMEHVGEPDKVMREVARTLVPGGAYVFTVPTYKGKVESERRARYLPDGTAEHLAEPEYHGNPVSDQGALVTFHYGYDLPELIHRWSGLDVEVVRFHDHRHGLIGDMTEVYICTKHGAKPDATPAAPRERAQHQARRLRRMVRRVWSPRVNLLLDQASRWSAPSRGGADARR